MAALAERRSQSYVSYVETGQKLVDVVEMMEWAEAIGFDAGEIIKRLAKVPKGRLWVSLRYAPCAPLHPTFNFRALRDSALIRVQPPASPSSRPSRG